MTWAQCGFLPVVERGNDLHQLGLDEVQRVVLNLFPQSQTDGWLPVKTGNPLLLNDLCGDGPKDV